MVKAGDGAGVEGLEAAAFGRGEVVGEREGGEVVEGAANVLEAALELDGPGRYGRGIRLGPQAAKRVAQQQAAIGLVGAGEELDQPEGLGRTQAVALGAVEDLVLIPVAELAQGARERRPDDPLAQLARRGVREAGADGQARLDPGRLVTQQPRDAARRQSVLLGERADHLRLVERGHGARRGVGQEQQPLVLDRRGRALDDHGYRGRALLAPALEALEAVEDLEAAVGGGGDPQRQLCQLLRRALALARAQLGEAGAEPVDGQRPEGAGGLGHDSPVAAPPVRRRPRACRRVSRSEGGGRLLAQREVGDHAQVQLAAPLLVLDLDP